MTYEDICREAGIDPARCNADMRAVITYMTQKHEEEMQETKGRKHFVINEAYESPAYSGEPVRAALDVTDTGLTIEFEGYGHHWNDDQAPLGKMKRWCIWLHSHHGVPTIRLYTDINEEDETHFISFEKAKIENRKVSQEAK
ncbi:MAG TPA: hypothetical protein DDY27_11025 [Hyphomonadaceae bacterium]|nr:hypothetical protein [Hyphomonadaceae bacterium]